MGAVWTITQRNTAEDEARSLSSLSLYLLNFKLIILFVILFMIIFIILYNSDSLDVKELSMKKNKHKKT